MLSAELFKKGIDDLKVAFPELEMTEERVKLWYRFLSRLTDAEWEEKIGNCIKHCIKRAPLVADVLDEEGFYDKIQLKQPKKV